MKFPARFELHGDRFIISFRDIPEADTQGDSEQDGIEAARNALINAASIYLENRRQIPQPSEPEPGECLIELPPAIAAMVLQLNETLSQNVRLADSVSSGSSAAGE